MKANKLMRSAYLKALNEGVFDGIKSNIKKVKDKFKKDK